MSDFEMYHGDTYEIEVTLTDPATSDPINIDNVSSLTFTVKRSSTDADDAAVFQLTDADGEGITTVSAADGEVLMTVLPAHTADLPRRSYNQKLAWDVQAVISGKTITVASGSPGSNPFVVKPDVTHS